MSKKEKRAELVTFNKKNLKSAVLSVMYEDPVKLYNYKQIASALQIRDEDSRKLVIVVLDELADSGYLEQQGRGKFRLRMRRDTIRRG